jgi:hypothetical protein
MAGTDSSSDYTASSDMQIGEHRIENDVEGIVRDKPQTPENRKISG